MNSYLEFRSTIQRVKDAATILANRHGAHSRVTIIGTRHLLIAWHWHPSDKAAERGTYTTGSDPNPEAVQISCRPNTIENGATT